MVSLFKNTDVEDAIRGVSFEHLSLANTNLLGNSSIEAISKLQKLSSLVLVKRDSSQPLIEQAVTLKTDKMVSHSLDRICSKVEQTYHTKVFLKIVGVLHSSLKRSEFGEALKDLGVCDVDSLFHILFETVKIGCSTNRDNDVIVAAIQSVFEENGEELHRIAHLCVKFLVLYASGMLCC